LVEELKAPEAVVKAEEEPFFPYVEEAEFDPSLKPIVDPYVERMGFLPNAMKLYAHRPEIAATLFKLNSDIMRDESSTLPQLLKRKLAVICCAINGCAYCTSHSCSILKRQDTGNPLDTEGWEVSEEELQGIISGDAEPNDDMERVTFRYVRAASEDPSNVSRAELDELAEYLTPPQIVELACVVGFWKFYNTVHDSLHIPTESHLLENTGYINVAKQQAYGN